MKNYLATAMALALVAGVAGLSVAPFAAAGHNDCHKDFNIAGSEPANPRTLAAGDSEIGRVDVTASGGDETLNVRLDSANDELQWQVFHLDANLDCVEYTQGDCDGPNTIETEDETQTCTLFAPTSGMKSYWVEFVNLEDPLLGDPLDYSPWAA